MAITTQDINKIARLSRIAVGEQKKPELISNINKILNWMETLNEVDTTNIEPLTNVHFATLKMMEDKVNDGGIADLVLKNAPEAKYDYFTVPKMIE